jgi:hypothetical protein
MLHWWMTLDLKGKLRFWAIFGLLLNGALHFIDMWMPKLLIVSILVLILTLFMKDDSAEDI